MKYNWKDGLDFLESDFWGVLLCKIPLSISWLPTSNHPIWHISTKWCLVLVDLEAASQALNEFPLAPHIILQGIYHPKRFVQCMWVPHEFQVGSWNLDLTRLIAYIMHSKPPQFYSVVPGGSQWAWGMATYLYRQGVAPLCVVQAPGYWYVPPAPLPRISWICRWSAMLQVIQIDPQNLAENC